MFDNMTRQQAKDAILEQVKEYCAVFHEVPIKMDLNGSKKGHEDLQESTQGKENFARIPYAGRVYDSQEMCNLVDSALDFWLTAGSYTAQFEKGLAEYVGASYCSLVNSGSSANLLAFMALTSPLLGSRRVLPGDEIITVAACFPTTIAPMIQYGAVPVFIDITIPQYNLDVSRLETALSPRTKAVMAAHTLGNPFDLRAVRQFCDDHGLWLIEDNCDALGTEYDMGSAVQEDGSTVRKTGGGQKTESTVRKTGSVGDIGTSSFYPPHHITMGEGGAVYTSNPLLHKVIRSLRDWGRDCVCDPGQDNRCGHRFDRQYGRLPLGYDHKYVYSHFGYNLKATDMQAAVGVAQLSKLPAFVARRRENFTILETLLKPCADKLILPEACPHSSPSWFGYLMICRDGVSRNRVTQFLEDHGVQTRTLFAGNILFHPCADELLGTSRYRVSGSLENTDRVLGQGFWVGLYPGLTEAQLSRIAETIIQALAEVAE